MLCIKYKINDIITSTESCMLLNCPGHLLSTGGGAQNCDAVVVFFINRGQYGYIGAAFNILCTKALLSTKRKYYIIKIILEAEQQSPRNFWELNIFQCLSLEFLSLILVSPFAFEAT